MKKEEVAASRQQLGLQVKEFRKETGLTQLQLSQLLEVTEPTISKIEAGKWISLEILIKLGGVLGFFISLKKQQK